MRRTRLLELREIYRKELFDSVIPFWLEHSLDHDNGGQFNSLDRDGSVFDSDKAMWLQGRALWMFAKLYNEVERRRNGWTPPATFTTSSCAADLTGTAECSSPSPPMAARCAKGATSSLRPSPLSAWRVRPRHR